MVVSILFENESVLKETSFGVELIYQSEIKVLKRKNINIINDVNSLTPDILFLELSNCSLGLIDKVKSIKSLSIKTKIVLLVNSYSDHIFWVVKKFSLYGMLLKTTRSETFYEMLSFFATQPTEKIFQNYKPVIEYEQINKLLSNAEKQIVEFIGKGLTSKEISNMLNLSKRTVDNHRMRILKKLNCKHASKLIYISTLYNLFKVL